MSLTDTAVRALSASPGRVFAELAEHASVEMALAEAPEPAGAARLMIDTLARSRLVTTHVADHTEPCLRCGKPTTQFALPVTATGHTCVARVCGDGAGPRHRASDT